jgi:hypothetical protein
MSYASEALRRHWLPNIQTVVGRPQKGFGPYLLDQNYQVYNRPTAQRVELFFSDASPVLSAFAFDITRFASAAVESVVDTRQNPVFNKSTAWLLIRSYYAAFFAAHAISRMLGISFTRFETTHCNSVLKVARLFHASFYLLILKCTSMLTSTGAGLPCIVAGLNLYCATASNAAWSRP